MSYILHIPLFMHHAQIILPIPLHLFITDNAINLPAVVAGVVVAFLLLTLLIAGIIVGVVLLRRMKRREKLIKNKDKSIEMIECAEKRDDLTRNGQENAAGHSEQWVDKAASQREWVEQHGVDDLQYESIDVQGQGSHDKEEGNAIKTEREYCNIMDLDDVSKDGVGHSKEEDTQHDDQPKGTPNVVYVVVDKSKKKRKEKTQGGASATTTQGVCTEEQHYEMSSAFGQDWFGNVVGGKPEENHVDVEQGSLSNDVKETGPPDGQRRHKENMNVDPSASATEGK